MQVSAPLRYLKSHLSTTNTPSKLIDGFFDAIALAYGALLTRCHC